MKIEQLKTKSKKFREFKKSEWKLVHPELYGVEMDEKYWDMQRLFLKATEGKEIVGVLTAEFMAGVLYIPELIVGHNNRGKGIGKTLLQKAEDWTKSHGGHEVYLVTGAKWKAVDFYKKLGYTLSADLPKHYSKTDFVLFRKFLD